MNVTITTDGGFTGRGLGDVSVDSEVDERVRAAVADARPESWQREYRTEGADLIHYTLTIGDHTVSWQSRAEIPRDLEELFEAVWAHK